MSKRADTIRSLFTQSPPAVLSTDNEAPSDRRMASGAVRSMKETFSSIERENEVLRGRLAEADQFVEIDPASIDPSPFADRFEQDDAAFEALKQSMATHGQEIPVLLRPSPLAPGRYQTAYGHRRIRAARALGRPVRALVRTIDDDALVIAQGLENSAREDLSFIERAVFALRLEEGGRARAVIQQALAIDRAEASKLIAVARAAPPDLVRAIGKAPRIGRGRWQAFAEALADRAGVKRALTAAAAPSFAALDSDGRFACAFAAATRRDKVAQPAARVVQIKDSAGKSLAEMRALGRDVKVRLADARGTAFAAFLADRMPALFDEFRAAAPSQDDAAQD